MDQRSEVETLDVVAAGADGLDLRLSFGAFDVSVDVALGADAESGRVCNCADGAHDAADQVEQLGPLFLLHRPLEPRLALLLVMDLQQPEGDAIAFVLEFLLDLVVVQTALMQELVDILAGPEVCEVVVRHLAALVEFPRPLEGRESLEGFESGSSFLSLQTLAELDDVDPSLAVVGDCVLLPVFEEVLQDLRRVGLEIVVGGDALVELLLPVVEDLLSLLELSLCALDVVLFDADVELVGALLDQFGELLPVFL